MRPTDHEELTRRRTLRLGLWNGMLTGFALAIGTWTLHVIPLITYPVSGRLPSMLLGCLALIVIGGLGGWLAALARSAILSVLIWSLVGVASTWVIGHTPYELHNLTAWLADRRFWGLAIYPFNPAAEYFSFMTGFFIILLLAILGLLQNYRLEGLSAEVNAKGRFTSRAWFGLLVPLPFVLGVGLVADNLVNAPFREAPRQMHEAIRVGRTYEGNLFDLALQDGINYNAISGVRELMSADYELSIAEFDLGASKTLMMVAHFDNGAWINCRVVNGNIFHCYDASQPYMLGFASILTTGAPPDDCLLCTVKMDEKEQEWLDARRDRWSEPPQVTRLAQQGAYVLAEVSSQEGDKGLHCLFSGTEPVRLERCWEVGATGN